MAENSWRLLSARVLNQGVLSESGVGVSDSRWQGQVLEEFSSQVRTLTE